MLPRMAAIDTPRRLFSGCGWRSLAIDKSITDQRAEMQRGYIYRRVFHRPRLIRIRCCAFGKRSGVGFQRVRWLIGLVCRLSVKIGRTGGTLKELEDVRTIAATDNLHFDAMRSLPKWIKRFIQNGGVHGAVFGGRTDTLTITNWSF